MTPQERAIQIVLRYIPKHLVAVDRDALIETIRQQIVEAVAKDVWVIYCLSEPGTLKVRYVGITHTVGRQRYNAHITEARRGAVGHKANWIRSLLRVGQQPVYGVLEVGVGTDWAKSERGWIKHFRDAGASLVNNTDGGEGTTGRRLSQEARDAISRARKGKPLSPEHRALLSAARLGKKRRPFTTETLARMSLAQRGRIVSPQARANNAAALRGRKLSPEALAKRSATITGRKRPTFSEEWRRRISEAKKGVPMSEEMKARISATTKGRLGRPHSKETRAKISAAQVGRRASEETKRKMSLAQSKRQALRRRDAERSIDHIQETLNAARFRGLTKK